jgi:hypothetical protein
MEQGEMCGVHPFKKVSREYLDTHYDALLAHAEAEPLTAALLCAFGEDFLVRERDAADYLKGVKQQGGITVAAAVATVPTGWLPEHSIPLLAVRELFGNLAPKVYAGLKKHYPLGLDEELQELIVTEGVEYTALVSKNGNDALAVAQGFREELSAVKSVLIEVGREDSFFASLLYLTGEHLEKCSEDLRGLAQTAPYYFPRIVKSLKPEHLKEMPGVVYDIGRTVKSGVSDAVQALNLITPEEQHFASRLVFHSGIFTDEALAMRGPGLLARAPEQHHALLTEYGHAFWGLSSQFKEELHDKEQEHRNFILAARELTGQGAGHFFANLKPEYWNGVGLAIADRYREATGFVLKQRGDRAFKTEVTSDYSSVSAIAQEYGNLRWLNRYTRMQLGYLRTTLLESNAENYLGQKPVAGTLTASMLAFADPKNAFGDPVFYDLLNRLDATGTLFLSEVGNLDMIDKQFARICEDPARGGSPENPLQLDQLILGAHSNGYSMQLSGVRHCPPATAKEAELDHEQMIANDNYERLSRWKKYMAPGSTIILIACSAMKPVTNPDPVGKLFEDVFTESTVLGLRDVGNLEGFSVADAGRIERLDWREGHTWW